jgi:molybdopterin-guanine dinucleotide biosynthesis protein A
VVRHAVESGVHKIVAALSSARVEILPIGESSWFQNVNTPEEWSAFLKTLGEGK